MEEMYVKKDRRRYNKSIFVERRKGIFWMYGQILALVILLSYLFWLIK